MSWTRTRLPAAAPIVAVVVSTATVSRASPRVTSGATGATGGVIGGAAGVTGDRGCTETSRDPRARLIRLPAGFENSWRFEHAISAGRVSVAIGSLLSPVQTPIAYMRSSWPMREKNLLIAGVSFAATSACRGPSMVLATRLARRLRSLTNHRTVSLSTSGITEYASAARTSTSGITNRSDNLTMGAWTFFLVYRALALF